MQELLKELEQIKAQEKTLNDREALCKEALFKMMQEAGIEKEESPYGTVRIQRRCEKYYGAEVRAMEEELKAAKKLKDDLGDYDAINFKHSLVYLPPKELF
jgi:cytochrome c556